MTDACDVVTNLIGPLAEPSHTAGGITPQSENVIAELEQQRPSQKNANSECCTQHSDALEKRREKRGDNCGKSSLLVTLLRNDFVRVPSPAERRGHVGRRIRAERLFHQPALVRARPLDVPDV